MIHWPKKSLSNWFNQNEWIKMQNRKLEKITETQAKISSIKNVMLHNMSQPTMNNI